MKKNKLIACGILSIALLFSACNSQPDTPIVESFTVDELVEQAKTNITEIYVSDFKKLYDDSVYCLIDVRDEGEYNSGYIPGAINISRGLIEFRMEKESFWEDVGFYMPFKEDLIIVYCKKGSRAALAAEAIQKMGYLNVKSIKGGLDSWKRSNPSLIDKNNVINGHGAPAQEEGGC